MEGAVAGAAPTSSTADRALAYALARKKTIAAWAFAVAVSIGSTLMQLAGSYSGFFAASVTTWEAVGLVVLNVVATVVVIVLAKLAISPQRPWVLIVVVATSLQVLVNSEFQTGIVGADAGTEVEGYSKINIGKYYNPLEKSFSQGIDSAVIEERTKELRSLIAAYPAPDGATALLERFLDRLELSTTYPADKKAALEEEVRAIVAKADQGVDRKVRALGIKTYEAFGRRQVQVLIRQAGSA
jgi:hypothetical protein